MPETAETLALMAMIDASFFDHPWLAAGRWPDTFSGSGMRSGDGASGG